MRTTTRLAAVRAAAAAGALAVGLAGLGLGATASAEPEPPAYGNIDTLKTSSLTVHKHVKSVDGTAARPTGDDTLTQPAVEGVGFKAFKIDADLSTPEGWKTLSDQVAANKALSPDVCDPTKTASYLKLTGLTIKETDKAGVDLGKTDDKGVAKKDGIPQGAYLVCETDTADAKVGGTKVKVTEKALPFIATVPFYDAQGANATKGWIYDVHTYPKNTTVEAPKKAVTVDEAGFGMGTAQQVTYTIDAKIPDIDDNTENFKYFTIWDQLAKGSSDIEVSKVEVVGETTDLTGKYTKEEVQNTRYVHVDFNTKDGLIFLRENPGKTIRVTIKAKIDALPEDGTGLIGNTGNLAVDTVSIPHDPSNPPSTPTDPEPPANPPVTPPTDPDNPPTPTDPGSNTPTNKVVSAWGNLVVRKYDANDTITDVASKAGLNGAEFEVRKAIPKDAKTFPATCEGLEADMTDGGKVTVGGKTTFTSSTVDSKKGIVTIPGLFIDSKATEGADAEQPDNTTRCYFLVETKAPAGYVLDSTPKPFVVTAGTTAATAFGANQIGNTKHSVPALPLTGASGQVLMMAGGAALVLLAGGTVMVARRREAEE